MYNFSVYRRQYVNAFERTPNIRCDSETENISFYDLGHSCSNFFMTSNSAAAALPSVVSYTHFCSLTYSVARNICDDRPDYPALNISVNLLALLTPFCCFAKLDFSTHSTNFTLRLQRLNHRFFLLSVNFVNGKALLRRIAVLSLLKRR
jgi:hypothetical protein